MDSTHGTQTPSSPEKQFYPLLTAALVVSAGLMVIEAFHAVLVDAVTEFVLGPLALINVSLFLVVGIWGFVYVCRKRRFKRIGAYGPLAVQAVAAAIVIVVPLASITRGVDFQMYLGQREQVVAQVVSGDLQPNVSCDSSLIQLPPRWQHLSRGGGDIVVCRQEGETQVLFYTYRGILGHFSGFVYCSNGRPPEEGDFAEEYGTVERLGQDWYWVRGH